VERKGKREEREREREVETQRAQEGEERGGSYLSLFSNLLVP
jgi:hypothetical protein